jgi:hypothetical protein
MPRRVVAVAALLLVAGCTGFGPRSGGDSSPQTTTLEPADPVYETPLDESSLVADHVATLRDAETFTVVTNTTLSDSHDASYATRDHTRIRLSDGAMYSTERGESVVQMYTLGNGTEFVRFAADDGVKYLRQRVADSQAEPLARAPAAHALALFDFEHAGVTARDGDRVHVYRASGPDTLNVSAVTALPRGERTVYAAKATLRVRSDGLVTFARLAYQVGTEDRKRTVEQTLRVSDLGETDVSPPAWLSVARNETRPAGA